MNLPTPQEIEALHRRYAPYDKVFNLVWTHCRIVSDIALQLVGNSAPKVNADLVRVGCLLHDIGVHSLFNTNGIRRSGISYIMHGTEGETILKGEGFPEVIWRFASHHTGVGLSKKDIVDQRLPLPREDYLAETVEELLVMYADKFHSKSTPPYFNSYEWYRQDIAKFGNDRVAKFEDMAKRFGVPDLGPLSKKYRHAIR